MSIRESEHKIEFKMDEQINAWIKSLQCATDSDKEELKMHLFDQIDDLKKSGLDEEEAFLVASKRMGNIHELDDAYLEANQPVLQMRKSLIIFAGVLLYFLSYYFLLFSSKLLLIVLLSKGNDGISAVQWITRYLEFAHFIFILFVTGLYFRENLIISFIKNIKIKPKHGSLLLATLILFIITDTCLLPISKNLIRRGLSVEGEFYDVYFYFGYSFPLMICISFVILYFRYYKKVKI